MARPRKTDGRKTTGHVRLPADLANMVGAIAAYERVTIQSVLEPLVRGEVERRFNRLPASVRRLRANP